MLHLTDSVSRSRQGRALLLLTASCVLVPVAPATAQEFQVGPGLVAEIEMTSTAPRLRPDAQAGLNRAVGSLAFLASGLEGRNREEAIEALEGLGPPQTVTQNITVYVKGARIRVDIGENSLLGRLTPDGTVEEWAILDPASGRLMATDFFDRAVQARSAAEYEAAGIGAQLDPPVVRATDEFRTINGHSTRLYRISERVLIPTQMDLGAAITNEIEAWVATEGPYQEDPGIVQFFRLFGEELNLSPAAGLPAPAMVLETEESGVIHLTLHSGSATEGLWLAEATSSTVIKNVSRRELDDEMFSGFEREEKGCDCSCSAFKELEAISKLPKQEQQNHPKAMSLAMCARECGGAWASFPKSVYKGGECPADG